MFHKAMLQYNANVLALQPYRRNDKQVYRVYSYSSVVKSLGLDENRFYPKDVLVATIKDKLNTHEVFFEVLGEVLDEYPRKFILTYPRASLYSYEKNLKAIRRGKARVVSPEISLLEEAKEYFYDIYISTWINPQWGKFNFPSEHNIQKFFSLKLNPHVNLEKLVDQYLKKDLQNKTCKLI